MVQAIEGAAFGVVGRQKGENEAVEWTSDQAVLDAVRSLEAQRSLLVLEPAQSPGSTWVDSGVALGLHTRQGLPSLAMANDDELPRGRSDSAFPFNDRSKANYLAIVQNVW